MSVRRLAKDQPASFAFSPETLEKANWWLAKYPADRRQSGVIPILWLVQKQEGWVSEPAIRAIAELCDMAVIRVLEVATFYVMFHTKKPGKYVVDVCTNISCSLCGAEKLLEALEKKLDVHAGETTADGKFTLREAECLGSCHTAPCLQVNEDHHENLSVKKAEEILAKLS